MAAENVAPPTLPRPLAEATIHRLAVDGEFIIEPACKVKIRGKELHDAAIVNHDEDRECESGACS